jgi:hypothetical protein
VEAINAKVSKETKFIANRDTFSKVLRLVAVYSKFTRALCVYVCVCVCVCVIYIFGFLGQYRAAWEACIERLSSPLINALSWCVRVCACVFMCACVRACSCVSECICMHVCKRVCYVCMYACMHACMNACIRMYVCTYAFVRVCMYVCMYVHTCYVLISPPMPIHYVLAAVFASCFYVLIYLLQE